MGHREDSQVPRDGCDIQGAGCYRPGDPCAPKQEDSEALNPGWGGGLAANCTAHCPQHIIGIPEGKGRELISCRLPPHHVPYLPCLRNPQPSPNEGLCLAGRQMITIRKVFPRPPHSIPPFAPPQHPSEAMCPNIGQCGMWRVPGRQLLALNHMGILLAPLP